MVVIIKEEEQQQQQNSAATKDYMNMNNNMNNNKMNKSNNNNNESLLLLAAKRMDQAKKMYEENHPGDGDYGDYGFMYWSDAANIYAPIHGEFSWQVAEAFSGMGKAAQLQLQSQSLLMEMVDKHKHNRKKKKKKNRSIEAFEKSLGIYQVVGTRYSNETLQSYQNLGKAHIQNKNWAEAVSALHTATRIQIQMDGSDEPWKMLTSILKEVQNEFPRRLESYSQEREYNTLLKREFRSFPYLPDSASKHFKYLRLSLEHEQHGDDLFQQQHYEAAVIEYETALNLELTHLLNINTPTTTTTTTTLSSSSDLAWLARKRLVAVTEQQQQQEEVEDGNQDHPTSLLALVLNQLVMPQTTLNCHKVPRVCDELVQGDQQLVELEYAKAIYYYQRGMTLVDLYREVEEDVLLAAQSTKFLPATPKDKLLIVQQTVIHNSLLKQKISDLSLQADSWLDTYSDFPYVKNCHDDDSDADNGNDDGNDVNSHVHFSLRSSLEQETLSSMERYWAEMEKLHILVDKQNATTTTTVEQLFDTSTIIGAAVGASNNSNILGMMRPQVQGSNNNIIEQQTVRSTSPQESNGNIIWPMGNPFSSTPGLDFCGILLMLCFVLVLLQEVVICMAGGLLIGYAGSSHKLRMLLWCPPAAIADPEQQAKLHEESLKDDNGPTGFPTDTSSSNQSTDTREKDGILGLKVVTVEKDSPERGEDASNNLFSTDTIRQEDPTTGWILAMNNNSEEQSNERLQLSRLRKEVMDVLARLITLECKVTFAMEGKKEEGSSTERTDLGRALAQFQITRMKLLDTIVDAEKLPAGRAIVSYGEARVYCQQLELELKDPVNGESFLT